ncbi:hypothetical protein ACOSQ3_000194 [Xanthoceras sorbifolium]
MSFAPKMLNRQRSHISPPPLAADQFRVKLTTLIARHDRVKIAYQQLESQIKTVLLQTEEMFASLAIPLMKLVGLKTFEMAEEGRFTTIIIDTADSPDHRRGGRRNGVVSESPTASSVFDRGEDHNNLEIGNYATKATVAGRELVEKQQTQVIQLVQLLRQTEVQVNSRQENILQTLANHRVSLQKLFRKAVYCLSNFQSQNNNDSLIMVKLLQGLFDYMGKVFGSVENGVEELMQSLADHMCNPMVEYVKGLKADMKFGTCSRLLATVEEMEMELRNGRLELEEARKRVRVAEEGKVEALSKLHETHERVRRFNKIFNFLSENKREPRESSVPYKFLGMEEGQENDDKQLWELLKKRQYKAPESPMGPPQLVSLEPNTKRSKSRPGNWNHMRGLQGHTCLEARIPLGSSPSATIQRAVSRKRITP